MAGRFAPKEAVILNAPKRDHIKVEYLAKCDGTHEGYPTCVAVKGVVFDVSGNDSYGATGSYKVFVGKDPSNALGKTSTDATDCHADTKDLTPEQRTTLDNWYSFFSQRYNQIGIVPEYYNQYTWKKEEDDIVAKPSVSVFGKIFLVILAALIVHFFNRAYLSS